MVEVGLLADCILAQPQEAGSLCHPYTKHFGKTTSCPRRRHRDYSLLVSTLRLQDVVCQLVGIGMVQGYIMTGMLHQSKAQKGCKT